MLRSVKILLRLLGEFIDDLNQLDTLELNHFFKGKLYDFG